MKEEFPPIFKHKKKEIGEILQLPPHYRKSYNAYIFTFTFEKIENTQTQHRVRFPGSVGNIATAGATNTIGNNTTTNVINTESGVYYIFLFLQINT